MTRCLRPSLRARPRRFLALLTISAALLGAATATAAAAEDHVAAGNRAYSAGQYDRAIADYEAAIAEHGASRELLFNLGNAQLQSGDAGRALVSYERARLLGPTSDELRHNLDRLRAESQLAAPVPSWAERILDLLGMNQWLWIASILFWSAAAALFARSQLSRHRGLLGASALGLGLSAAFAGACAFAEHRLSQAAVVVTDMAPVRLSPFTTAAAELSLAEGTRVRVERSHSDFVHVRDAQGRAGWMARGALERIAPEKS